MPTGVEALMGERVKVPGLCQLLGWLVSETNSPPLTAGWDWGWARGNAGSVEVQRKVRCPG